jgi:hypothetical protein
MYQDMQGQFKHTSVNVAPLYKCVLPLYEKRHRLNSHVWLFYMYRNITVIFSVDGEALDKTAPSIDGVLKPRHHASPIMPHQRLQNLFLKPKSLIELSSWHNCVIMSMYPNIKKLCYKPSPCQIFLPSVQRNAALLLSG